MRRLKWTLILLLCPSVLWTAEVKTLSLQEAVQIALERNRSLQVARSRVEAREYGVKEARSAFMPHLTAGASYTRLDERPYVAPPGFERMFEPLMAPFADLVTGGYLNPTTLAGLSGMRIDRIYMGLEDNYDINLSLRQPLFTGGTTLNSYRIAQFGAEAEKWKYRRDEHQVRYEVTEAFLNLVTARELRSVTEESIARSQAHLTDLENLHSKGIVIERDLLRAQVSLSNARLLNLRAQNGVKLLTSHLCHLLSFDLDTDIIPDEIPDPALPSGQTLEIYTAEALDRRPEMKATEADLAAAGRLVSIRKGEYLPKLFLVGNYDWKRPNREIEPEFYDTWSVALALQLDLFHGGAKRFRLQQAKLSRSQIEQGRQMLADAIALEVKQAHLAIEEAQEALTIAGQAMNQAEESYRVARDNFKAGTATNTDVLDAQNDLTQAQMQRVAAHADLLLAEAKLARATAKWDNNP